MLVPQVVGFKLSGKLKEGTTATDLVLTVTQMLRKLGVVGKFVEFYGPGISELPLADRATIANMAPEYGATCGIFPVDAETLKYLRLTGRTEEHIALTEAYFRAQGMFHTAETPEAEYSATLELDLATVEPSVAGPKRPQDRVLVPDVAESFASQLPALQGPNANKSVVRQMVRWEGEGGHASATGDVTSSAGAKAPAVPELVQVLTTTHDDRSGGGATVAVTETAHSVQCAVWCRSRQVPGGWIDRDCGDYELHEYEQSVRDGGGGAAGEEGCREGTADASVGEDEPGTGFARGDGLLHASGAAAVSGCAAVPGGWVWMHDVHWELGAAADGCVEGD